MNSPPNRPSNVGPGRHRDIAGGDSRLPASRPARREAADRARQLAFAGRTDPGRQRGTNQDRFAAAELALASGEATVLIVADGMGGAAGGEVASQEAVAAVMGVFNQPPPGRSDGELLADGVAAANASIYERAQVTPELRGMGTTLVAVLVRGPEAVVAHVGDSRAYLIRDGQAHRLTADHSWVAEQVRMGDLTEAEGAASDVRNVLTRSVGVQPTVVPDVSQPFLLRPGDALVLCSDGLHGVVDDATIAAVAAGAEPATAAQRLVDLANRRGGPDNVTAVIGRYGPTGRGAAGLAAPETHELPSFANRTRRSRLLIAVPAALLLVAVLSLVVVFATGVLAKHSSPTTHTPAATAALTAIAKPPAPSVAATAALPSPTAAPVLIPNATPLLSPSPSPSPSPSAAPVTQLTTLPRGSELPQCAPGAKLTLSVVESHEAISPCRAAAPGGSPASYFQSTYGVTPECLYAANQDDPDQPAPMRLAPGFGSNTLLIVAEQAYRLVLEERCKTLETRYSLSEAEAAATASTLPTPSRSPSPSPARGGPSPKPSTSSRPSSPP